MKKMRWMPFFFLLLTGCAEPATQPSVHETGATPVKPAEQLNQDAIQWTFLQEIPESIRAHVENQLAIEEGLEVYFVEGNDTYVLLKPNAWQMKQGMSVRIESISRHDRDIVIAYRLEKHGDQTRPYLLLKIQGAHREISFQQKSS